MSVSFAFEEKKKKVGISWKVSPTSQKKGEKKIHMSFYSDVHFYGTVSKKCNKLRHPPGVWADLVCIVKLHHSLEIISRPSLIRRYMINSFGVSKEYSAIQTWYFTARYITVTVNFFTNSKQWYFHMKSWGVPLDSAWGPSLFSSVKSPPIFFDGFYWLEFLQYTPAEWRFFFFTNLSAFQLTSGTHLPRLCLSLCSN